MKINFGELRINDITRKHINECLDSNHVTLGPKVKLFEEKWAKLFDYPYATAVNSGTSAVMSACMALYDYGAKPGDYIICPALSFIASATAIRAAGFNPLFVDVKLETLNIDESKVEDLIKSHYPVAILAVNLMGKPARLDILADLAHKYNMKLIVDNCEGYGSKLQGKFSLDYADFECTSHYVAHIVCSVEFGFVCTKTERDNNLIKSIRSHGREPDSLYFNHLRYGLNLKPTDLHACVGLGEIDDFWTMFNRRKDNLYNFRDVLKSPVFSQKAYFVEEDEGDTNAPHGFSITIKPGITAFQENKYDKINQLTKCLDDAGIQWKKNFGSIPHHKAFRQHYDVQPHAFSNAQFIGWNGIHIGCHYWLSDEDVNYVGDTLRSAMLRI